jgi:hypothetical protein
VLAAVNPISTRKAQRSFMTIPPESSEIKGKEQPSSASYGGQRNPFPSTPVPWPDYLRLFHGRLPYDHALRWPVVKGRKLPNPAIPE